MCVRSRSRWEPDAFGRPASDREARSSPTAVWRDAAPKGHRPCWRESGLPVSPAPGVSPPRTQLHLFRRRNRSRLLRRWLHRLRGSEDLDRRCRSRPRRQDYPDQAATSGARRTSLVGGTPRARVRLSLRRRECGAPSEGKASDQAHRRSVLGVGPAGPVTTRRGVPTVRSILSCTR